MIINNRKTEFPVSEIFPNRWSSRAMSGEEINNDELMSIFEAARWAPSSRNEQPWRFIYGFKNTPTWKILFNLLVDANKVWAEKSGVLLIILSKNKFEYKNRPNKTHSFDTGAAWQNIALQASMNNLIAHGIAGFDYEKARIDLKIPNDYEIEAMTAIGKPGKKEDLPKELQERETQSSRKQIKEIVMKRQFGGN